EVIGSQGADLRAILITVLIRIDQLNQPADARAGEGSSVNVPTERLHYGILFPPGDHETAVGVGRDTGIGANVGPGIDDEFVPSGGAIGVKQPGVDVHSWHRGGHVEVVRV